MQNYHELYEIHITWSFVVTHDRAARAVTSELSSNINEWSFVGKGTFCNWTKAQNGSHPYISSSTAPPAAPRKFTRKTLHSRRLSYPFNFVMIWNRKFYCCLSKTMTPLHSIQYLLGKKYPDLRHEVIAKKEITNTSFVMEIVVRKQWLQVPIQHIRSIHQIWLITVSLQNI